MPGPYKSKTKNKKKTTGKKVKSGMHRMPDGTMMKNSAMKRGKK
jgi:hypothetical protein